MLQNKEIMQVSANDTWQKKYEKDRFTEFSNTP